MRAHTARQVGLLGREIPAVGLGAMPLSTAGRPDRAAAMATVHAALDAGVGVIDTADAYCLDASDTGHNERLVGEALAGHRAAADVVVATKGGHVRGQDGSWDTDGRPEHLRRACEASLRALDRDVIELYQFHRPDPKVPFAESVGALAALRHDGLIANVGLSNVDVDQIAAAQEIVPIASVQNQLSPQFRSSLGEVRACADLGIAFLAWSPLGGSSRAASLDGAEPAFAEVAERHQVSPQRVAIAWVLAQGPTVIAIPGARRPATFLDSFAAADLHLDEADLRLLSRP